MAAGLAMSSSVALRTAEWRSGDAGWLLEKLSEPAAGAGMALFTAALGLYGGVLWCGELQGFIIHEMMPNPMFSYILQLTAWPVASNGHKVKH